MINNKTHELSETKQGVIIEDGFMIYEHGEQGSISHGIKH